MEGYHDILVARASSVGEVASVVGEELVGVNMVGTYILVCM
jgi:hypothetical protein